MTISLPVDLQQSIESRAAKLGVLPDDLVCRAVSWYLAMNESVLEELDTWQAVRDEALQLTENPQA